MKHCALFEILVRHIMKKKKELENEMHLYLFYDIN